MEQELNRSRIGFHKSDNAFLAVDDVAALQTAADRLSPQIIRKQLDYWTFLLGPKFSKKERSQMNLSRFYAITQIEYCRNFIFKRHFPIHKIFERSCELGLWRLTANRISEIFGVRLNKRLRGKLATVLDQIEHGHHVFRAYWKNAFLKQYEKFSRYLRNELCSNNLRDFGLKKGLDHLDAVRTRFQIITDRFAGFQAQCLNVHVDFPLLQRLALPLTVGTVRYPGIKIHDARMIRLLEVLLHGGNTVGGWTAKQIHQAVLTTFSFPPKPTACTTPRPSAKTQGPRPAATRRLPLCLPPHPKRRSGRTPVSVLPQAPLRPPRKQPFSPHSRPGSRTQQQTRTCLLQSRQGHPEHRRLTRRCMMLHIQMLKYSCLRSLIQESSRF